MQEFLSRYNNSSTSLAWVECCLELVGPESRKFLLSVIFSDIDCLLFDKVRCWLLDIIKLWMNDNKELLHTLFIPLTEYFIVHTASKLKIFLC